MADEAGPGVPAAGVSLGDCTLALYPFLPEEHAALWGRSRDRPGVSALGFRVVDLERAHDQLRGAGVDILREAPGTLVLDPTGVGDLEVVLVDELLPGDPRLAQRVTGRSGDRPQAPGGSLTWGKSSLNAPRRIRWLTSASTPSKSSWSVFCVCPNVPSRCG